MTALPNNRTIADLVTTGPLTYERFLAIAGDIARQVEKTHSSGYIYGDLNIHSVGIGVEDQVTLPEPTHPPPERAEAAMHDDLRQIGYLYTYILTGGRAQVDTLRNAPIHPVISEALPLDAWTILLPPEAKLLVEQLVSADPNDRIQTAQELAITIEEMHRMHEHPTEIAIEEPPSWVRLSVMLPMAVVLVVIIWVLVSVLSK